MYPYSMSSRPFIRARSVQTPLLVKPPRMVQVVDSSDLLEFGWVPSLSVRFRFEPVTQTVAGASDEEFCARANGAAPTARATATTLCFKSGLFTVFSVPTFFDYAQYKPYACNAYRTLVSQRLATKKTLFAKIFKKNLISVVFPQRRILFCKIRI